MELYLNHHNRNYMCCTLALFQKGLTFVERIFGGRNHMNKSEDSLPCQIPLPEAEFVGVGVSCPEKAFLSGGTPAS